MRVQGALGGLRWAAAPVAVLVLACGGPGQSALFAFQRKRARRLGIAQPLTGAVAFVQRFGSALPLQVSCVFAADAFGGNHLPHSEQLRLRTFFRGRILRPSPKDAGPPGGGSPARSASSDPAARVLPPRSHTP